MISAPSYSRISKKQIEKLHSVVIPYIQHEVKLGHYPSRREMINLFHADFGIDGGIAGLYNKAGLEYQLKINQAIKYDKAEMLTKIVLSILPKMGLISIEVRSVHQRGVDIIAKNAAGKKIGLELKAYYEFERVKARNIQQINRFITDEKLDYCYLITTTEKISGIELLDNRAEIIPNSNLVKFCDDEQKNVINYIRTRSVNTESPEKSQKQKEIIEYVKRKVKNEGSFTLSQLNSDLKLGSRWYFKNILEIYNASEIKVPSRLWGGLRGKKPFSEHIRNEMLDYLKSEISKGHYPSGADLSKKYGIIHVWNHIKMSELYRSIGVPAYRDRKKRLFKRLKE